MAVVFNGDGPSEFLRPGEKFEIVGFYELARHLNVSDEPQSVQRDAIAKWINDGNEPGPMLIDALREHGINYTRVKQPAHV